MTKYFYEKLCIFFGANFVKFYRIFSLIDI